MDRRAALHVMLIALAIAIWCVFFACLISVSY